MGKKPDSRKRPALSQEELEAWAARERDPEMRETLLAYTQGAPVRSPDHRPWTVRSMARLALAVVLPSLIWGIEILGTSRLLDAPLGHFGSLSHLLPAQFRLFAIMGMFLFAAYAWDVLEKDTEGRRWPVVCLTCYALLAFWQPLPSAVTRWFGTPHAEIAEAKDGLVRSTTKSRRLVPDRLVLIRPDGRALSIGYLDDEAKLGIRIAPGDRLKLSGERSALGFLVHHIARADPPR